MKSNMTEQIKINFGVMSFVGFVKRNFHNIFGKVLNLSELFFLRGFIAWRKIHGSKVWLTLMSVLSLSVLMGIIILFANYLNKEIVNHLLHLEEGTLAAFFQSLATLIGGLLAIIFSVSLFSLQVTVERFSDTTIQRFLADRKTILTFSLLALFVIIIYSFSLLVTPRDNSALIYFYMSIVMLLIVFILIYFHYKRMVKFTSPSAQIRYWESKIMNNIAIFESSIGKLIRLKKLETLLKENPLEGKSIPDENIAQEKFGFYYNFPVFNSSIIYELKQISGILKNISPKHDHDVIKEGLRAVENVLVNYLKVRETSTVFIPTDYLLSPDVDYTNIFDNTFQELLELSRMAFGNKDELLVRKAIDSIASVGLASVSISSQSAMIIPSHPVTDLSIAFISTISEESKKNGFYDVELNSIEGQGKIVLGCIKNRIPIVLETVLNNFENLLLLSIVEDKKYISHKIFDKFNEFLLAIIRLDEYEVSDSVEKILKKVISIVKTINTISEIKVINGKWELYEHLEKFLDLSNPISVGHIPENFLALHQLEGTENRQNSRIKKVFFRLTHALSRFYREIGEEFSKTESFGIYYCHGAASANIKYLFSLLELEECEMEKSEIESEILWLVSFYWATLKAHKKITRSYYQEFVDFLGYAGIMAIKKKQWKMISEIISCISSMTNSLMEKSKDAIYEAPRWFKNIIYVLLVARKCEITNKVLAPESWLAKVVTEFNKKYNLLLLEGNPPEEWVHQHRERLLVELKETLHHMQGSIYNTSYLINNRDLILANLQTADIEFGIRIVSETLKTTEL